MLHSDCVELQVIIIINYNDLKHSLHGAEQDAPFPTLELSFFPGSDLFTCDKLRWERIYKWKQTFTFSHYGSDIKIIIGLYFVDISDMNTREES